MLKKKAWCDIINIILIFKKYSVYLDFIYIYLFIQIFFFVSRILPGFHVAFGFIFP